MECPLCGLNTEETMRMGSEGKRADYFVCSGCRFTFRFREDGALVGCGSLTEEVRAKAEKLLEERIKGK